MGRTFEVPDAEGLLRRAMAADALAAVGGIALRHFYKGNRNAAYAALLARPRGAHPLIRELLAEPSFFAQIPAAHPKVRVPRTPRHQDGWIRQTVWRRRLGVPVAPVGEILVDPDSHRVVAELPLGAGQRTHRDLANLVEAAAFLGAVGASIFFGWPRSILMHNPFDEPLVVEAAGETVTVQPHTLYERRLVFRSQAELRASTLDGVEIERVTATVPFMSGEDVLWNPAGRGVHYSEQVPYAEGLESITTLLPSESLRHIRADDWFRPPPRRAERDTTRVVVGCAFEDIGRAPEIASQAAWLESVGGGKAEALRLAALELRYFPDNHAAAAVLAAATSASGPDPSEPPQPPPTE